MTNFIAYGTWGTLVCDCDTGDVKHYDRSGSDWEKPGDGYDTITRLDVKEWRNTYPDGDLTAGHDILDFGSWDVSGEYVGPEAGWRESLWRDRPEIAPRIAGELMNKPLTGIAITPPNPPPYVAEILRSMPAGLTREQFRERCRPDLNAGYHAAVEEAELRYFEGEAR